MVLSLRHAFILFIAFYHLTAPNICRFVRVYFLVFIDMILLHCKQIISDIIFPVAQGRYSQIETHSQIET